MLLVFPSSLSPQHLQLLPNMSFNTCVYNRLPATKFANFGGLIYNFWVHTIYLQTLASKELWKTIKNCMNRGWVSKIQKNRLNSWEIGHMIQQVIGWPSTVLCMWNCTSKPTKTYLFIFVTGHVSIIMSQQKWGMSQCHAFATSNKYIQIDFCEITCAVSHAKHCNRGLFQKKNSSWFIGVAYLRPIWVSTHLYMNKQKVTWPNV